MGCRSVTHKPNSGGMNDIPSQFPTYGGPQICFLLLFSEEFSEEFLHRLPRTLVGFFIVCGTFGIVIACSRIAEAMDGIAIAYKIPVHACRAHFILKGEDLFRLDEGVICSVERQHLSFDVFRVAGGGGGKAAMEAYDTGDIRAAPRQLKHGCTAEAVADGSGPVWVNQLLPFQHRQC